MPIRKVSEYEEGSLFQKIDKLETKENIVAKLSETGERGVLYEWFWTITQGTSNSYSAV